STAMTTRESNDRLCVQSCRHQTIVTAACGATTRTMWLLAYDPNSRISLHPGPNDFATAALSSPADAFHTTSVPTLDATYSDGEGDAGTLTMRLCSDSGCVAQMRT